MKYPRRSPYLIFQQTGKDEFIVENYLYSESYRLSYQTASFLKQLDGNKDPHNLLPDWSNEHIRQLLEKLEACGLLAPKRKVLKLGLGSFLYPLIYCYPGKSKIWLAKLWNVILMIMIIPMLAIGMHLQSQFIDVYMQDKSELYLSLLIGSLIGVAFHEISHTCAGLAYGGTLSEIGIGMQYFLPMGYVIMDDRSVKSKLRRIQIDAAGIEMNIFLYGCFMCLAAAGFFNPFVMMLSGTINLMMAIVNILPLSTFDGMKILSIITGKEDVLEYAKALIKHRKEYLRRQVCTTGRVAAVTASYMLVGFQTVLPMLLVYEGISFVRLIKL